LEGPRAFLVDLDGTLIGDDRLLAGAAALLERIAGRYAIVSNNSTHSAEELSVELGARGLAVPADRIVLAGTIAVEEAAAAFPGGRALVLGSASLREQARRAGLIPARNGAADVVILARDLAFAYDRLRRGAALVRAGAALVVANPDLTHPGAGGEPVPETGALLQALLACTGPVPFRLIGKPEPLLFRRALKILGAAVDEALMIGDNLETDAAGAARLGMRCVLVGRHRRAAAPDIATLMGIAGAPASGGGRESPYDDARPAA
jgi:HAD superfamily hydrolase (TIGR01450 family)